MLSDQSLEFLDALCRASHAAYPEGGTTWTYVEAANQAHARFRDSRRRVEPVPLSTDQLGRWIQWARGNREPIRPESISSANQLVELLRQDLRFDEVLWSLEDNGSDMTASLHFARTSDNRYFSLELFWSED